MKMVIISLIENFYDSYKSNSYYLSYLATFLRRDVGCIRYVKSFSLKEWINDPKLIEVSYGESDLEKDADNIIITTSYLYDEDYFLAISKKQLLFVLDQWMNLIKQRPKEIIITQDDDGKITIKGNDDVVMDAIVHFHKGKYRYPKSVDKHLYHLCFFLIHEFEVEGLSHSFILNEWANDPKDTNIYENWLLLEKSGDMISILRSPRRADKSSAFVTTKEKLRDIYRQFEQVKLLKPKIIIITRVGDDIKVEGAESEV